MSDQTARILIADDDHDIHDLVHAVLEPKGYQLFDAFNGDDALEMALLEKPDLVVLDVMMPGLNGWELARYFRSKPEFKTMGIVVLTGIGETLNDMTSPLYGADLHLNKPFEVDDFSNAVSEVLKTVQERTAKLNSVAE